MRLCVIIRVMDTAPISDLRALNAGIASLNITQQEISSSTGISQSQISRILAGQTKKTSKSYRALCVYVFSKQTKVTVERVKNNPELVQALAAVWDGSDRHAKALASVIRSLASLSNHLTPSSPPSQ
jgi:hypothetical protein